MSMSRVEHVGTVYQPEMKLPPDYDIVALVGKDGKGLVFVGVDEKWINKATREECECLVEAFRHCVFGELANRS